MNPTTNPSVFIDITPNLRYDMEDLIRARIRDSLIRLRSAPADIRPGDTVAIKINLAVPAPPEAAVTTHPLLLRAVILELQALGAAVTVVEDCEPEAVAVSGTAAVLTETGVPFINLREGRFQPVASYSSVYSYAADILNAAHLISIPKLKTHLYTYYTGAIKNMFGCIPKQERRELHQEMATPRFSEHLVNIYAIKPPTLVVLDGILAMEGIGPTQGTPKQAGYLLISNDGVLLDYYAAALMRYEPRQVEMIRIALERALNSCPPEKVDFTGAAPADLPPLAWNLLPVVSGPRRKRIFQTLCGPIRVILDRCQRCGTCQAVCPFQAIENTGGSLHPSVDQARCQFCFCCLELCPHLAIMPLKF